MQVDTALGFTIPPQNGYMKRIGNDKFSKEVEQESSSTRDWWM